MDDYFADWKDQIRRRYKEGNLDMCKSECEYLLRQASQDDHRTRKFCFQELSYCCLAKGEIDEAEKYTLLALENAKNSKVKDDYYSSYWNLGRIKKRQKQYDEAKEILNECLPFYIKHEMHKEAGQLYMTLANIHKEKENYIEAENGYKNTIELYAKAENMDDKDFDNIYGEMADLYIKMGKKYIWEAQKTISKIKEPDTRNALRKEVTL